MKRRLARVRQHARPLDAWVAAVIVVCMAVTFLVVYDATGSRLRSEIDGDLHGSAVDFAHALSSQHGSSPQALLTSARGYATAQPYRQASTLLFALIPGVGSASNHPELFGSNRPDDGESAAHQAQENAIGRRLLEPTPGYSTQEGARRRQGPALRDADTRGGGDGVRRRRRGPDRCLARSSRRRAGVPARGGDHARARAGRVVSGRRPGVGAAATPCGACRPGRRRRPAAAHAGGRRPLPRGAGAE